MQIMQHLQVLYVMRFVFVLEIGERSTEYYYYSGQHVHRTADASYSQSRLGMDNVRGAVSEF